MTTIKINRKDIIINIGDVFLDNGSCIILMSQKVWSSSSWSKQINPTIPKKYWKIISKTYKFTKSNYGEYKNMFLYKIQGFNNA